MDARTTSHDAHASSADHIELLVPIRAKFASTLRTLAASVGADLGFSIDEIDDVRLAISEVFSVLVESADESTPRARIEMSASGASLAVTLGYDGAGSNIELDELAEHILRSVTDSYEVTPNGISFVKLGTEGNVSVP
jgi:serine/threonine-protein kinase RsbW